MSEEKTYVCVKSERLFTAKEYIKAVTNTDYTPAQNNTIEDTLNEVESILAENGMQYIFDYPLSEIDHIVENEISVVLVEISGVSRGELVQLYRWYEVPDDFVDEGELSIQTKTQYELRKISGRVKFRNRTQIDTIKSLSVFEKYETELLKTYTDKKEALETWSKFSTDVSEMYDNERKYFFVTIYVLEEVAVDQHGDWIDGSVLKISKTEGGNK